MTQVTANGNTYSDDRTAAKDMNDGGSRTHLVPMLSDVMTEISGATSAAADAEAAAADAAALVASAAAYAAALYGTSTTSVAIGTGSKSFTTQTAKSFSVGEWVGAAYSVTPTNYMVGQVTSYNSGTGALVVNVVATGGSGTQASWVISPAGSPGPTGADGPVFSQARSAKTGDYTLVAGDKGNVIDCTSGTFTATFAAPATLTTGWHAILRNTGSGNVTVAHTSGNIDGLTSYVMYPGEARLFQCDGSTIRSQVLQGFRLFATSSTTVTMPPGYSRLGYDLMGAGTGGEGGASGTHAGFTQAVNGGCGGAGGGRHIGDIDPPAAGTTITLSVGAGGVGATGRPAGTGLTAVAVSGGGGDSSVAWSSVIRAHAGGGSVKSGSTAWGGEYLLSAMRFVGGNASVGWLSPAGGGSYMAGAAGGSGGGVFYNSGGLSWNQQGALAGGTKNTAAYGGGGAAGTGGTTGGNGGTAADSGGGGGGYGSAGAGGNGGAGTGYGSGGGGGGACHDGSAAGGNGGNGADGYACIVGLV